MEYMAKERECRHTEDTGESDHTAKGEGYFNLISIAAEGHHVTPTFSFCFSYISLRLVACVQCVGCLQSVTRVMFVMVGTLHVTGMQPIGHHNCKSCSINQVIASILHIS